MSRVPSELIREVQICTRAAAGLPDYNPLDPTLPALPSLSAAIASSDPSPPDLRCNNCKALLLRGSESIVCLYCGFGPHYDVAPDLISFTSTVGYQWLLRSLRLDGSEMVDTENKGEQDQGQRSPKALTRLSDFLNFKIPWPAESETEATGFSDKHSEESKRSSTLPGVAPDKFFLKLNRKVLSDVSTEQPFTTTDRKDIAALENQNLFQNVQSSKPVDSSSEQNANEAFSGWEAEFQSAGAKNQHSGDKSSEHFAASSADFGNKFHDPVSLDRSIHLEVDLSAEIDSVFGPGKDLSDGKSKDIPAVAPAFDDWNSDDMWNNLSSNKSDFDGGFDATVSTKNGQDDNHRLQYSEDLSASDDFFQDFQSPTNYPDMTENKINNEEHKTMDEDLFEDWNDFTGSTSSQVPSRNAWTGGDYQVSTSDQKSSEIDLFSLDNSFGGGDFSGFPQPNLSSTSTSNSNAITEDNPIMTENPALNWFSDENNGDLSEKSSKDDVTMLISQMHDLSFMLETNLSVPSASDVHNSSPKD